MFRGLFLVAIIVSLLAPPWGGGGGGPPAFLGLKKLRAASIIWCASWRLIRCKTIPTPAVRHDLDDLTLAGRGGRGFLALPIFAGPFRRAWPVRSRDNGERYFWNW